MEITSQVRVELSIENQVTGEVDQMPFLLLLSGVVGVSIPNGKDSGIAITSGGSIYVHSGLQNLFDKWIEYSRITVYKTNN